MLGQTRAVITRPLVTGFETSALIHAVAYLLTGDGALRAARVVSRPSAEVSS
jgi:hypothetical protein